VEPVEKSTLMIRFEFKLWRPTQFECTWPICRVLVFPPVFYEFLF